MAAPAEPMPGTEHLELLRRARRVQRAAVDADTDTVHDELCELRNALVDHLRDERSLDRAATDLHARLTRHGQERLVTFVERLLLDDGGDGEDDGCTCLVRTAELRALLVRQIRLEGGLAPPGP